MRKTSIRATLAAALGVLMALSFGTAHASVSLTITTANGATIYSIPELEGNPGGLETRVRGTASFDTADGGVGFDLTSGSGESEIPVASGQADCDVAAGSCAWSFPVRFFTAPGTYHVHVTATEPSGTPATASIDINVI